MVQLVERIVKDLSNTLKAEGGSARTVVARISTTSIDRDGDVMLPSGVMLADYRKNPIVLFSHNSGSLPIGTAESIKQEADGITATVRFAQRPDTLPSTQEWLPDTIHSLMQQKVLRGFSVGFSIPEGGAREPSKRDISQFGEGVRRVISKWKLLEFSVVPIPANQDALSVQVSKGLKTRAAGLWGIQAPAEKKPTLVLDTPRKTVLVLGV